MAKLTNQWHRLFTAGLLVIAVLLLSAGRSEAKCYNWSKAKGVIDRNKLRSPSSVRKQAIKAGNEVISINLCRRGSRYVYRLKVIGRKKRARHLTIDAGSGSKIGGKSIESYVRKKINDKEIEGYVKRKIRQYVPNF